MKRNYFIFRINYGNEFIKKELKKGILRQGWGKENMSLLSEDGKKRSKEDWIKDYFWDSDEKNKKKRYDILKIMLSMKKDDIIIIPKFPEQGLLTVAKVKERYNFDGKEKKLDDFGHYITLEEKEMKIFNYKLNEFTRTICGSLTGYQSAVNNVRKPIIKESIEELYKLESSQEIRGIEIILKEAFDNKIKDLITILNKFENRDVENIVKKLFEKKGYDVVGTNKHNHGKDGDADLILIKSMPLLYEVDSDLGQSKVYIQVKQKIGKDENEAYGIMQLKNIVRDLEEGNKNNVYKILVSTGEFSEELRELANKEGIILIDGVALAKLIMKYL